MKFIYQIELLFFNVYLDIKSSVSHSVGAKDDCCLAYYLCLLVEQ